MGQARPTHSLEAQSFILKDSNGIKRAELATLAAGPLLRFFDSAGQVKALLSANGYTSFGTGSVTVQSGKGPVQIPITRMQLDLTGFLLSDDHGKPVMHLGGTAKPGVSQPPSPEITLFDSDGRQRIELNGGSAFGPSVELQDENGYSRASLNLIGGQPAIIVNDSQGFAAQLGSTDLVTGPTGVQHKTSAASVVLFGKDGKVLWSAP